MSSTQLAITHVSASQNQKEVTINAAINALDDAVNRGLDVSVAAGSVTLTNAQFRGQGVFRVTGATVAGRTVTVPQIARVFIVRSDAANTQAIGVVRGTTTITVPVGVSVQFRTDGTSNGLFEVARSAISFLGLSDTPAAYTGAAGRVARVNAAETGMEFRADNFAATTDPAAANDNTQGYRVGSQWFNTATQRLFLCTDATTGAAVWRAVITREVPALVAGDWAPGIPPGNVVNATAVADTLFLCPLIWERGYTIDALGLRIQTGAAGTARLGLYDTTTGGLPGALLAESTDDLSTAAAADLVTTAITAQVIRAGKLYWLGVVFSGAPTYQGFAFAGNVTAGITALFGHSGPQYVSATNYGRLQRTAGVTYSAGVPFLPATVGAVTKATNASSPVIYGRIA